MFNIGDAVLITSGIHTGSAAFVVGAKPFTWCAEPLQAVRLGGTSVVLHLRPEVEFVSYPGTKAHAVAEARLQGGR